MSESRVLNALVLSLCLSLAQIYSLNANENEISSERNSDKNVKLISYGYVIENIRNIQKYRCKQPRTKVVSLKSLFNDTGNRAYIPSCVVLHVCDDESGCCYSETLKCVAKRTGEFQLYFMVKDGHKEEPKSFTFQNDTECECREKDYRPRVLTPPRHALEKNNFEDSLCENPKMVCPKPFIPRPVTFKKPYKCRCDCATQDRECHNVKKGKYSLSPEQQRCVLHRECQPPVCGQHLTYDLWLGECRNRDLKHIRHSNYHNLLSHRKRH